MISMRGGEKKKKTDTELQPKPSRIRSSFNDLVIYNDQGQPYIDINRLVYKPKKVKHDKEKEKLTWYLPDYLLIIFNFLSTTFSAYYFLNGVTIVNWKNSMQSFTLVECKGDPKPEDEVCRVILQQYGTYDSGPYTIVRFDVFDDSSIHGVILLGLGVLNGVNVVLGVYACLKGNRTLLISHLCLDTIFLIVEIGLISIMKYTGRCDKRDIEVMKSVLSRHVQNYARNSPDLIVKKDTMELDLIQLSLTCCGVGNWTDYLPVSSWSESGELNTPSKQTRYSLDKSEMILPFSCCQQWWVRNLYCAQGAHLWAYPTATKLQAHQFRQRISQLGCLPKMVSLCNNMVAMAGAGGMGACFLHVCFTIIRYVCAIIQMENISTLIRERKRIFKHKVRRTGAEGEENSKDADMFPSVSTILDSMSSSEVEMESLVHRSRIQPKEKDIANLRSRKALNQLRVSTKNTHIDKWITEGQAFVQGGMVSKNGKPYK